MGKKDRKNKKNKDEFSANPFKALKGFAVEEGEKSSSPADKPREQQPEKFSEHDNGDDADLFLRQMKQLGVEEVGDDDRGPESEPPPAPKRFVPKPSRPQADEELFRQAMDGMDVNFRDEFPEEEESAPSRLPRRMKQVRRGTLTPEKRLDLHGFTRAEAVEKVGFFLQDCAHQGIRTVLLITGRGYGSEEGPVLRPAVEKYLDSKGRTLVAEWGRAPKRYGGEGALVVFLKDSQS